ncbi:alpha/beta fold hydrolase [Streptomyces sp. NPDC127074]|uniref:alpha/beta fold hydrolase n=1 Tax=Streptomyces sp. NPDC127074 TaxID=3347130 RepID=UPI003660F530
MDVPGQPGLSAGDRPGRHRLARYGQWLQEVLDEISRGPTILVGHSLAGAIALACDVPQLIGRVLVSPAGLTRVKVTGRVLAASLPWLARPTEARSATLLRQMHGADRQPSAELVTWMTLPLHLVARAPPRGDTGPSRAVTNVVATGEHDVFLSPSRLASPTSRHLGGVVKSGARCGAPRGGRTPGDDRHDGGSVDERGHEQRTVSRRSRPQRVFSRLLDAL